MNNKEIKKDIKKTYSSSFKYPSEDEYFETKQAAAALRMGVAEYIIEAVLEKNKRVLNNDK